VADTAPTIASERTKKTGPKTGKQRPPRRSGKLSEYKVTRILRGFADGVRAQDLAKTIRVSEPTIRETYMVLRKKLMGATLARPQAFGRAGLFLFEEGQVSDRGRAFLEAVRDSPIFAEHCRRHCPRLRNPKDGKLHLFEVAVRVFCHVALPRGPEALYPPETWQAMQHFLSIAEWIKEERGKPGFAERHGDIVRRYAAITDQFEALVKMEQLLTLKSKSTEHRFANEVLFDGLKGYINKRRI